MSCGVGLEHSERGARDEREREEGGCENDASEAIRGVRVTLC